MGTALDCIRPAHSQQRHTTGPPGPRTSSEPVGTEGARGVTACQGVRGEGGPGVPRLLLAPASAARRVRRDG